VSRHVTIALAALLAAIGLVVALHSRRDTVRVDGPRALLTPQVRAAGLNFDASVAPADRQLILRDVALARPEARRLLAVVDGLVTISVGAANDTMSDAVGYTQPTPTGFNVRLDLADVYHTDGERGVQRLVLHELGHVVDMTLVSPELAARLDAPIPVGYGCEPGTASPIGCAPREERFAETFSKWCTGDIGVNLPLGYKVAPPASLDDWGAQLVSGIGAA
jgi:hypothetical protein